MNASNLPLTVHEKPFLEFETKVSAKVLSYNVNSSQRRNDGLTVLIALLSN